MITGFLRRDISAKHLIQPYRATIFVCVFVCLLWFRIFVLGPTPLYIIKNVYDSSKACPKCKLFCLPTIEEPLLLVKRNVAVRLYYWLLQILFRSVLCSLTELEWSQWRARIIFNEPNFKFPSYKLKPFTLNDKLLLLLTLCPYDCSSVGYEYEIW